VGLGASAGAREWWETRVAHEGRAAPRARVLEAMLRAHAAARRAGRAGGGGGVGAAPVEVERVFGREIPRALAAALRALPAAEAGGGGGGGGGAAPSHGV